ncbi:MAG: bifunctional adenosylcobinamide kinase/adenosylcobinamide-phosphate guanylyltransferase [Candidatus Omnitrophota bacterium]
MNKITFILGGARSGKSGFALKMAKEKTKKAAFVATCQALDKEMKERIRLHKKQRPKSWKTFEEPKNIASLLKRINLKYDVVIIDCLTLLISNLMLDGKSQKDIEKEISGILAALNKNRSRSIIVSNEVGLGIVPESRLGRDFRDIAGRMNQIVAKEANEVFFMASGLPIKIKGE